MDALVYIEFFACILIIEKNGLFFCLKDYSKAKVHLKNVVDPERKKIAVYFQAQIDMHLGQYDELKQKLTILSGLVFPFSIEGFLQEAKQAIHAHHHLDFFDDIKTNFKKCFFYNPSRRKACDCWGKRGREDNDCEAHMSCV
jgi:hypothetical protein